MRYYKVLLVVFSILFFIGCGSHDGMNHNPVSSDGSDTSTVHTN